MFKIRFLFYFLLFTLFSCSDSPNERGEVITRTETEYTTKNLPIGKADTVFCRTDPSQSYTLYLPSTYSKNKRYPLLFLFDPHADGNLPIEKYQAIAERYGFVFAASNNSKNGLDKEQLKNIIVPFFKDVIATIAVDSTHFFTAGFSGGAKAAQLAAFNTPFISGVISCSVALVKNIKLKIPFIGIAGKRDMNLLEMILKDNQSSDSAKEHTLLTFDGIHEWPPEQTFEEALLFLELTRMKKQSSKIDTFIVNHYITLSDANLKGAKQEGNILKEVDCLDKKVQFLNGITNTSAEQKQLKQLIGSASFKNAVAQQTELFNREKEIQKTFKSYFSSFELDKISSELTKLESPKNTGEKEMFERIKGFLSNGTYSYASQLIDQKGKEDVTEKVLAIYKIVDPINSEHAYLSACLFVKKGNTENCITSLKEAINLGFSDVSRLENDGRFLTLRKNPDFNNILNGLRK